jgi:menin
MEVHWAHRMMASSSSALPLVEKEKELFPLKTVSSVVSLFESVLKRTSQPDLALFSIICGYFENTLTCNPNLIQAASQQHQLQQQLQQQQLQQTSISNKASSALLSSEPSTIISTGTEKCLTATFNANDADDFPPVELDIIEALYIKFRAIIKSSVDLNLYGSPVYATRELVKKVSDVIWNTLTRTYYKDRAHLQSIYSYLTGL